MLNSTPDNGQASTIAGLAWPRTRVRTGAQTPKKKKPEVRKKNYSSVVAPREQRMHPESCLSRAHRSTQLRYERGAFGMIQHHAWHGPESCPWSIWCGSLDEGSRYDLVPVAMHQDVLIQDVFFQG
jgi:hypothetical protein